MSHDITKVNVELKPGHPDDKIYNIDQIRLGPVSGYEQSR